MNTETETETKTKTKRKTKGMNYGESFEIATFHLALMFCISPHSILKRKQ